MDDGSGETVITMLKAMAIGLAAGYFIWGYRRPKASDSGSGNQTVPTAAPPAPPSQEASPAPDQTASDQPEPSAPSGLLTERPDDVDDLQKIKGVGPKMEAILNQKGVWQYRQIANFGTADLLWLDNATGSFPGRAERDDWIGQAKALQAGKS